MGDPRIRSNVREVRRERRVTQSDLAAAVGVSRQTIIALEGDDYAPSVEVALKIAHALGCTVEHLFELNYDPKLLAPAPTKPRRSTT